MPADLLSTISLHYLVWVFLASLGILQLAAARAGRTGLLLFPSRGACAVVGALLVFGGFAYFFSRAEFGVLGLEGAQQFLLSGACALAAVLVCRAANGWRAHRGALVRVLRGRLADEARRLAEWRVRAARGRRASDEAAQ